jgi:hypothetical protein
MEKIELLVRPANINTEDWSNVTRVEKWRLFFEGGEDFGFTNFLTCVRGISNDSKLLAKYMNRVYGVLNSRIHVYIDTREVSNSPFREDALNSIALCLDKVEV